MENITGLHYGFAIAPHVVARFATDSVSEIMDTLATCCRVQPVPHHSLPFVESFTDVFSGRVMRAVGVVAWGRGSKLAIARDGALEADLRALYVSAMRAKDLRRVKRFTSYATVPTKRQIATVPALAGCKIVTLCRALDDGEALAIELSAYADDFARWSLELTSAQALEDGGINARTI